MFARRRIYGAVSALLVSALVAGGALLGGTAASAEELTPDTISESTLPTSAPEEAPGDVPVGDDTEASVPEDAPAVEVPVREAGEADSDTVEEAAPESISDESSSSTASEFGAVAAALPETLEATKADGGALDWGFKSGWRNYVRFAASGTQTPYSGASVNADGTFHFPESAESTYDPVAKTGVLAFTGGISFDSTAHGFSIALQNPRIDVAADGSASVSAETSVSDTAGAASVARIVVATIPATGNPTEADGLATWAGAAGVFAPTLAPSGLSYQGQATDPFTFSTSVRPVEPEWSPELSVALADGSVLSDGATVYKDDQLVVTGSGFDPLSHPRPASGRAPVSSGDPTGNYVVFGNFAAGDGWKPSGGAASSTRSVGDQRWAMTDATFNNLDPRYVSAVAGQRVVLSTDGTFEATLTAKAAAVAAGSYGVFTFVAGGGENDAAQELGVRLTYVDTVRPVEPEFSPSIDLFAADGSTPLGNTPVKEGDTIVVKGTGFDPYVNRCTTGVLFCDLGGNGTPIPADKAQGTFVVFGNFAESWRPSSGATSSLRKMDASNRGWLLAADTLNKDVPAEHREVIRGQWVELDPATGSFTWKVKLKEPSELVTGGKFGIYTYAGGVNTKNSAQELKADLNFVPKDRTTTPDPEAKSGGLQWGVRESFRNYVETGANGKINLLGAAKRVGQVFEFPQIKGGKRNAASGTGDVRYAGGVEFTGHSGSLALTLVDPRIQVEGSQTAVLSAKIDGKLLPVANIDLSKATRTVTKGAITWTSAPSTLRPEAVASFLDFYPAGAEMDPVTFTVGATSNAEPTKPVTPSKPTKPAPTPIPTPIMPQGGTQQAGRLVWGVSSEFVDYTTNPSRPAKGAVSTSGVGGGVGGYIYPQASSGSWNSSTHTGSVQYSGVVTFTGHKGAMVESFGNPTIIVNDALSGTLTAGGRTFGLNLAIAAKSVGANGEVTWSGVPVSGAISGSGGGGGGSFSADPVTFTVGAVNSTAYGATTVSAPSTKRTAASTPPATTGIRVMTPEEDILPGAEIEFEATGFSANERDILVVLYSDPQVLDDSAGANASGVVRWIGTLPEDIAPGEHTITLQGSINAGAKITVLKDKTTETAKSAKQDQLVPGIDTNVERVQSAGLGDEGSIPQWVWWAGAGGLLLIAGAMGALLVMQRKSRTGS